MRVRGARLLRKAAIALGVVVGVLLVGTELLLHTAPARGWLRAKLEALASSALDTRVEIERLESVSLVHARAGGVRIFDRGGHVVAQVAHLDVGMSPTWLIVGRLHFFAIVLDYPYVDLGAPLEDDGGGLLGVFQAKPGEPESPADSGAGLRIEMPSVRVLHARVDARLADARYSARDLDADVSLRIEPGFGVRVRQARCALLRDGQAAGGIDSIQGERKHDGEGNVRLAASVAGASVALSAKLGAESAQHVQTLSVDAHVGDVSSETLARFGVDADWLTAPITTALHVSGTTSALDYKVAVATPGGAIDSAGHFTSGGALDTTLRVNDLEPWRFLRAPHAKLSAEVRASAEPNAASGTTALVLAIAHGRYDGTDLPKVDAHGQWHAARGLAIERFEAAYDAGSVSGSGHVTPEGALELLAHVQVRALARLPPVRRFAPQLSGAVTGDVCVRQPSNGVLDTTVALALHEPAVGTTRAEALQLNGELLGSSLEHARVDARITGTAVHASDVDVTTAALHIAGGPSRYVANGQFGDKGRFDAVLTRERSQLELDASAHLVVDRHGNALDASIRELRYARDAVSVRALQASYLGAYVQAAGRLYKIDSARRASRGGSSELSASVRVTDLHKVTGAWLSTPIPGALEAQLALSGELDAPSVRADARYSNGNLHGLLVKAAKLSARADPEKGTLALELQAEEASGGSLEASIHSDLPHGAFTLAELRDAQYEVALRMQRVPLSSIDEWPHQRVMPTRVELSGELNAKGTLSTPKVDTKLETHLTFKGESAPLALALSAHYDPSALTLDLDAQDAQGPLLRTQLKTKLERSAVLHDMADVARFMTERSWQASVWLGARRVDELPGVRALDLPEALWPAQVSAQAKIAHEPGQEPDATLDVQAIWDPPGQRPGTLNCGLSRRPRLVLAASMKQGELRAKLDASVEGRHMLEINTRSDEPFDRWLHASAERAQPVSMRLQANALRLQDVPIVCEYATGFVDGSAALERALESNVTAEVDMRARELRFGQAPPIEATIAARADRRILISDVKLQAQHGSAQIAARLPLDGGGRIPTLALDAPAQMDIDLHNIEARALLGPITAVRTSGGYFEGRIGVRGSLRSPTLQGALGMRDLSLTLAEAGQRFEHVTGKLTLDGRHLHLDPTRVHDRNGSLEISGDATLVSMTSWQAELQAKAKRFRVRRSGVVLALLDGTLGMSATVEPAGAQVDITLADGRVALTHDSLSSVQSLDEHPDVTFVDDGPPANADRPQAQRLPVTLRFSSKNPFWIRRNDFSALVTTELRVEVHDGKPALSGPVEIERGMVELLGQTFDIEQGKITFTGGHQIAPVLELVAKRNVPGGAVVTIKANGELYDPQLSFEIDGRPVTAGEALSAATGASSGTGSDATVRDELSSMAAGIAGSVLTLGARRELGDWVPVLSIERYQDQTRVRAGVEADRFIPRFLRKLVVDAYVEGIFAAESADAQPNTSQSSALSDLGLAAEAGVLLELRFPKHLVGEAQYGPGQQWSLDLNYQP